MTGGTDDTDSARIRSAERRDLDAVLKRWRQLVTGQRDHGAHILSDPNTGTARGMLGQQIAAGNVTVAERSGAVVGFVTYHIERGAYDQDVKRGIVENIFVDPRERDRGIGSQLLDAAESNLADLGADVVAITALAANDDAQRLYRSRGYQPHRVTFERTLDE